VADHATGPLSRPPAREGRVKETFPDHHSSRPADARSEVIGRT